MRLEEFDCSNLDLLCTKFQLHCLDPKWGQHVAKDMNSIINYAREEFGKTLVTDFHEWMRLVINDFPEQKVLNDNQIQHQLYDQATEIVFVLAKEELKDFPKDFQQRFHSLSHEHAGKFLFAAPVIPPLELSDQAFRLAVKRRILMEIFDNNREVCCDCKQHVGIDPHGDRLFTCRKNTEFWMISHNAIVRCLSKLASEARISHVVEPRRAFVEDSKKRPDIILYDSHLHKMATIAIDVSVAHPVSGHLGASEGARSLQEREDAVPGIHLRVQWTLLRQR